MTILLDDRTFDALAESAALTELSKGAIIRFSITYYAAMVVQGTPMCANGQQCFCPMMHQRISSSQSLTPAAPPVKPSPTPLPDNATSLIPDNQTLEVKP